MIKEVATMKVHAYKGLLRDVVIIIALVIILLVINGKIHF